jgi:hypothetical protein
VILASPLGAGFTRRGAVVAICAAALVGLATYLVHGQGGAAAPRVAAPAEVVLVYAKPSGTGLAVRGEEISAARPSGTHAVALAAGVSPRLSPDGGWVAYAAGAPDQPTTVRLISTLGGQPRITGLAGGPMAWSPDSRRDQGRVDPPAHECRPQHLAAVGPGGIACERYSPQGHGDVWLMNGDGSDAHALTHSHAGIYPAA